MNSSLVVPYFVLVLLSALLFVAEGGAEKGEEDGGEAS